MKETTQIDVHRILHLLALLLAMVGLVLTCMSIAGSSEATYTPPDEKTFMTVETYGSYGSIVVDQDTAVMYYRSNDSYNKGTLTLLVDETGAPKLYINDMARDAEKE